MIFMLSHILSHNRRSHHVSSLTHLLQKFKSLYISMLEISIKIFVIITETLNGSCMDLHRLVVSVVAVHAGI